MISASFDPNDEYDLGIEGALLYVTRLLQLSAKRGAEQCVARAFHVKNSSKVVK